MDNIAKMINWPAFPLFSFVFLLTLFNMFTSILDTIPIQCHRGTDRQMAGNSDDNILESPPVLLSV